VSKNFPRHHWPPPLAFCQSRALTVVGAHVAEDVFEGVLFADIFAAFADDNGEFTFVIHLVCF